MNLSLPARAILGVIQFDAQASVKEISARTKLSAPVVQYQLRKLLDSGVIRRGSIINHFLLGLQQWQTYVALNPMAYKRRTALNSFFKKSPQVYWLAELGGDYHYGMSVTVQAPYELTQFYSDVSARFGSPFGSKNISHVLSYTAFRKKYISPAQRITAHDAVTVTSESPSVAIDALDRKILGVLSDPSMISNPQMARKVGIPRSTFEYRLKSLEEHRVIERHVYYINSRLFGYLTFRFLLTVRGIPAESKRKISTFALEDPNVVFLVECLGSSDFEIVVEVPDAFQTTAVMERLHLACGDLLEKVQVLPIFQQSTSAAYLTHSGVVS